MTKQDRIVSNLIGKDYKVTHIPDKPKKKNPHYRVKIAMLLTLIAGGGFFYSGIQYRQWRITHEWQVPFNWIGLVKDIKPVTSSSTTVSEVTKTPIELMESYKLAPVLKSIYLLESTEGKNDGCKDEGKVNGFGYKQNSHYFKCYDSIADVIEDVNDWFTERLAGNGNNLIEAVCYYNTGKVGLQTCEYSQNFSSVIVDYL